MKKETNEKLQELHERLWPARAEEKEITLKVELKGQGRGRLPLFHQYPGEFQALDGGLELDLEKGTLETYIHPEHNSIAERFYNGRSLFISLDNGLKMADIKAFVREHKDKFQAVLDGAKIVWDGSDHVSRLSDEAQEALDAIHYAAELLEAY